MNYTHDDSELEPDVTEKPKRKGKPISRFEWLQLILGYGLIIGIFAAQIHIGNVLATGDVKNEYELEALQSFLFLMGTGIALPTFVALFKFIFLESGK